MDLARTLFVSLTIAAFTATVALGAGCKDTDVVKVDASGVKGAVDHAPASVATYRAPTWQHYGDLIF